jgi:hypothetical protein
MVADVIISTDVPTLVRLTTLVTACEFNRTVPKLIVAGAGDRVVFPVWGVVVPAGDDGVPALAPLHAIRSSDSAKVSKTGRKMKRLESFLASPFLGEDLISGLRSLWIVGSSRRRQFPRRI